MFSLNNIQLKPSVVCAVFILVIHAAGVLAIYFSNLWLWLQVVLYGVIGAAGLSSWSRQVRLKHPNAICRLTWNPNQKEMTLFCANGTALSVERLRARAVLPFLVVLELKVADRFWPLPLFIFSDSCSRQVFRRLRVLAQFSSVGAV